MYKLIIIGCVLLLAGLVIVTAYTQKPGDDLYSLKIGFNEKIPLLFFITPVEEARWHSYRLKQRYEEAEQLIAKNKLTAETSSLVEKYAQENFGDFQKQFDLITSQKDDSIKEALALNLYASLAAHHSMLEYMNTKSRRAEIRTLVQFNEQQLRDVKAIHDTFLLAVAADKNNLASLTEQRLDQAEKNLDTSLTLFNFYAPKYNDSVIMQVQEKGFESAALKLQKAKEEYNSKLTDASYKQATEVFLFAQQIKLILGLDHAYDKESLSGYLSYLQSIKK